MPLQALEQISKLSEEHVGEIDKLAQLVPGLVFVRKMNMNGNVTYPYFSPKMCNTTGYNASEIDVTSDGCLSIIHWADREEHLKNLALSAKKLTTLDETYRIISKNGKIHWLKGRSRPRLLSDGSIRWDGILLDETDYRKTEVQLETILEHLREGLIIIDENGTLTMANNAALTMFGCAIGELSNINIADTFPDFFNRKKNELTLQEILQKAVPYPFETKAVRKDGTSSKVEMSISQVREEGRLSFIVIVRDINKIHQIRESLAISEDKFNNLASSLPGMLYTRVSTPTGLVSYSYVSEGCRNIFGCSPLQFIQDPGILPNSLDKETAEKYKDLIANPRPFESDERITDVNGNKKWVHVRTTPYLLENGNTLWHGMILDADDRIRATNKLKFLAYHDPVTRVLNRRGILRDFAAKLEEIKNQNTTLAVMSIGPDRFGLVNAMAGHAVGDRVLETICARLASCAGPNDLVGRIGGDRFVLVLNCKNSAKDLTRHLRKVREQFNRPVIVDEQEFDISVGIGVAMYPNDSDNAEDMIENSDAALDEAKRSSYSGYCRYSMGIRQLLVNRIDTLKKLRKAIENKEIIAHYQPQVDVQTGEIIGMEALARWKTEDGMVAPAVFIPIAEEYGLIDDISMAVLQDACKWSRKWQDAGIKPLTMAVNISARQFHNDRKLYSMIENTLEESGLDPQYLELELTESSAMGNPEKAVQVINRLRELGVSCAIDDFGTGYSSLSALKRFPISKLKIDRSFVTDISEDANDAAIVKATIAMARALNLHVLAEGVEITTHFEFLKELDCDSIQGYLFSRPLSPEQAQITLTNWSPEIAATGKPGLIG